MAAATAAAVGLIVALGDDAAATCTRNLLAEFPVEVSSRAIVTGAINGQPIKLMVDTGSATTALFHGSALRLGLRVQSFDEVHIYGVGGEGALGQTQLDTIQLGSLSSKGLHWAVIGEGRRFGPIDGLIGVDFFSQAKADLDLDLPHRKIRLIRPEGCTGDEVVYWGGAYSMAPISPPTPGSQEIRVEVRVDGRPLDAELDSGSFTILSGHGGRKLGIPPPSDAAKYVGGIGRSRIPRVDLSFKEFAIGQEVIKNPTLPLGDLFHADKQVASGSLIPTDIMDFPDMLLGMDFLLSHHVYVARSQQKIYLSYTGGKVFDPSATAEPPAPPAP